MPTQPTIRLRAQVFGLVLALGLTVSACGDKAGTTQTTGTTTTTPAAPTTSSTAIPGGPTSRAPSERAGETACDEVLAGIASFAENDFVATAAHFTKAIPLAQAEDARLHTQASSDLVAAVTYYSELAPEDYLKASMSSVTFMKYELITRGQCLPHGGSATPSDGGGTDI